MISPYCPILGKAILALYLSLFEKIVKPAILYLFIYNLNFMNKYTSQLIIIAFLLIPIQSVFSQVEITQLVPASGSSVQQFAKLEIGFTMPQWIDREVNNFLSAQPTDQVGLNPFNPDDISIEAFFFPPSNLEGEPDKVYGFFFKDYETIPVEENFEYWQEVPTSWNWRVRYAPDKPGKWTMQVKVTSQNKTYKSDYFHFECTDSDRTGFVEVDPEHKRFLQYKETEKPFYAVGMNVANPFVTRGLISSDPKQFRHHRSLLLKLAESKSNTVRLVNSPQSYSVEWEALNNYDAPFYIQKDNPQKIEEVGRLAIAWELDQTVDLLEEQALYYIMCFELHFSFMNFNPYNPKSPYKWENNPYEKIEGVETVEDFLANEESIKIYQNKLRYYFARWGYSSKLLGFELLSEMKFLGGERVNGDRYFPYDEDESFIPTIENWHKEMIMFLKNEIEAKQLISSSYSSQPAVNDSTNNYLDFMSMHRYGTIQSLNVKNRHKETSKYMARWEMPFFLGECGIVGADVVDMYYCMADPFINDLWATAMMGGFGAGIHWWWKQILANDLHRYFDHMVEFMDKIDFEKFYFTNKIAGLDQEDNPQVEYLCIADQKGVAMMGWVHNYDMYWNNLYEFYEPCLQKYNLTHNFNNPELPAKVRCKKIVIRDAKLRTGSFRLKWFNTMTGEWKIVKKPIKSNEDGSVTLKLPTLGNDPENPEKPSNYAFLLEPVE